jgi:hypothetical protein
MAAKKSAKALGPKRRGKPFKPGGPFHGRTTFAPEVAVDSDRTSHAREHYDVSSAPTRDSIVAQRVEYVAAEMAAGRWDGYRSRLPLAQRWGVEDSTVRNYSTEAHHLVAYSQQERDEKRRSLAAFVAVQRERAQSMTSLITGLPDFGAVLKAAELEAKFLGIELDGPKRLEVSGRGGGPLAISIDEIDETLRAVKSNTDDDDGGSGDPTTGGH